MPNARNEEICDQGVRDIMLFHRGLKDPKTNKCISEDEQRNSYTGYMWPFLVLPLVAFLIWAEDRSQNAKNKGCHNHLPKAKESEEVEDIISRIRESMSVMSHPVRWRSSLLIGIVVSIIILFTYTILLDYKRGSEHNRSLRGFPGGFMVVITTIVVFIATYIAQVLFADMLWNKKEEHTTDMLSKLLL